MLIVHEINKKYGHEGDSLVEIIARERKKAS